MSLLTVLEIIGNGIEELQKENRALKEQVEEANRRAETWYQAYQESQTVNVKEAESMELLKKRLREAMNDRDDYKAKLEAVEEYRDRLARELENASSNEMKVLRALNFGEPDEIIYAHDSENVSNKEENEERGR